MYRVSSWVVGMTSVTPTLRDEDQGMEVRPWIDDFPAGYMTRSMHLFPKQGEGPWRNTQDFAADKKMVRKQAITDSALVFGKASVAKKEEAEEELAATGS